MGRAGRFATGVALGALVLAFFAGAAGAATIKGRVTDEAGEPIAGISVCADAPEYVYFGGCAWSQADGRYAIEGILEAGYHVGFSVEGTNLNYAPQWYGGVAHPEESPMVAATGGLLEGIDAVMRVGGQIVGRVTDRVTGSAIADVEVCARLVGQSAQGTVIRCTRTEAAGEYDVKSLGTGEYTVEFRNEFGPNYVRATYPGDVSVTAGQITGGIDVQLSPGLQIEGDVIDAATGTPPVGLLAPYAGLLTCALDPATERRVQCAPIEVDGHYVLPGLPPGNYVVAFALDLDKEGFGVADGFVRRYWHEVQNFSEATPVGSATPTVISGIDAAITRGDEIPPPSPASVIQGTIHPAPRSPPGETRAKPHRTKPKKLHCKKGFRRVTKSRHQRCVKIQRRKGHHRPAGRSSHR